MKAFALISSTASIVVFVMLAYASMERSLFIVSAVTIVCCTIWINARSSIAVASAFALIATESGMFRQLFEVAKFECVPTRIEAPMLRSVILVGYFSIYILGRLLFQRLVINRAMTALCAVALALIGLLYSNIHPVLNDIIRMNLTLLTINFFSVVINTEQKAVRWNETIFSSVGLWQSTTFMPIPLPFLRVKASSRGEFANAQWSGIVLMLVTMVVAAAYNGLGALLTEHSWPVVHPRLFRFIDGSAYRMLESIDHMGSGAIGHWLGIVAVGIGALVRVSIGIGYSVAMGRMCGYLLPSNWSRQAFTFRTYTEFLKGFYFYYSYLVVHVFYPRVHVFLRPMVRGFTTRWRQLVTVSMLMVYGGLVFNLSRYLFPFYYSLGLKEAILQLTGGLLYFVPTGMIIAYSHQHFGKQVTPSEFMLWFRRLWIFLTYSILTMIKTSQRVPGWSVDQIFEYLKRLFI